MIRYIAVDPDGTVIYTRVKPQENDPCSSPSNARWWELGKSYPGSDKLFEVSDIAILEIVFQGYPTPKPGQYIKIDTVKAEYEIWDGAWDNY